MDIRVLFTHPVSTYVLMFGRKPVKVRNFVRILC
jgi:hypothetical protein